MRMKCQTNIPESLLVFYFQPLLIHRMMLEKSFALPGQDFLSTTYKQLG